MDNSLSMVEMHSGICEDIAGNSTNISPKVVLYQLPYGEK